MTNKMNQPQQPNMNQQRPHPGPRQPFAEKVRGFIASNLAPGVISSYLKTIDENETLTPEAESFVHAYLTNEIVQALSYSMKMVQSRGKGTYEKEDIESAICLLSDKYKKNMKMSKNNQAPQSTSQDNLSEPADEPNKQHQDNLELLAQFRQSKIDEMNSNSRPF